MDKNENKLSDYIDILNAEQEPEKHRGVADTPELQKCLTTIRLIRSLREPVLPDSGYPQRLAQEVSDRLQENSCIDLQPKTAAKPESNRSWFSTRVRHLRHKWILPPVAAVIAGLFLFVLFTGGIGLFNPDVVSAMGKAVNKLTSYHGVLEMSSKNAAGEQWMVRRVEIWSEGDKYAVKQNDGTLTVNNGQRKWQTRPQSQEVALLPLVPDPGNGFDLQDEAKRAMQYPHTVIGSEIIAGREAKKVEISPLGGSVYYLWVDTQTNLPMQLQTAMQNALQTTYTFICFEPNTKVDNPIFAYQTPVGYKVVEKDPGQLVATVAEAASLSKLNLLLPQEAPTRIFAFKDHIALDYGDSTIVESIARGPFSPAPNSALGSAAGGPLEVWGEQLRWQQNGIEIQVEGTRRVELARQITSDLKLPDSGIDLVDQTAVKVPVDVSIVKADQQQTDAGHGPWQLDPLQVALTFVNLKVSPQGIVGEPKISAASFKLGANNGVEAVVEVTDGPVKRVYLKRLVRQDETGIWSVIAYSPR